MADQGSAQVDLAPESAGDRGDRVDDADQYGRGVANPACSASPHEFFFGTSASNARTINPNVAWVQDRPGGGARFVVEIPETRP